MSAAQDDPDLIPARDGDRDFFIACHHAAYRATVEQMFPWSTAEQDALVSKKFDQPGTHVICRDGAKLGVVGFHTSEAHVLLRDLFILPEHQGAGIGGRVLCRVQDLAKRAGVVLRLRTLRVNLRAKGFYEKHGFRVSHQDDLHWHMIWGRC